MVKTLGHLLFVSIVIQSCPNANLPSKDARTTWIEKNAINVRSISPKDTAYTDLAPLKEIIGDARVVLLGEQTHGGATTFEAKVRLVKFLHKEMGFGVMAFESGMYDCAKIWQQMQLGKPMEQEVLNSMFYMYATSTEVKPLFPYMDVQQKTNTPLIFTGMDSQHTGEKSQNSLVTDLKTYLDKLDSERIEEEVWAVFKRKVSDIVAMKREVTNEDKMIFYQGLEFLKSKVAKVESNGETFPDSSAFWFQILKSIESQAMRYWGDIEDMDRDRQMADNMSWLLNYPFKDKKVIIWAHNFHIARGLDPVRPMGHYLKNEFKDEMYAIGFTGYDGLFVDFATNKESKIVKPDTKSIEQSIRNTNWKYAILDFTRPTENGSWLKQPQKGRLFNFNEQMVIYPNIYDGLFYIQTTTPTIRE